MKRKDRRRLLDYFRISEPRGFFELRDRAMLLLILNHKILPAEISELNLSDCSRDILRTDKRRIELYESEKRAIVDYLAERIRREGNFTAPVKEALFVDCRGRRITVESASYTFRKYLDRLREDER